MCGTVANAPIDGPVARCSSCGEQLWRASAPVAVVAVSDEPAISVGGTIMPRHLAAGFDNLAATMLALGAAVVVPEEYPALVVAIVIGVYLAYYLVSEGLFSTSPAKMVAGLAVVQFNGEPCTWRQSLIRTLFRVLEVNPLLLGGLPAAARIVLSRHRQRFGDRVASTIVVPRCRVTRYRKASPGG